MHMMDSIIKVLCNIKANIPKLLKIWIQLSVMIITVIRSMLVNNSMHVLQYSSGDRAKASSIRHQWGRCWNASVQTCYCQVSFYARVTVKYAFRTNSFSLFDPNYTVSFCSQPKRFRIWKHFFVIPGTIFSQCTYVC